MPTTQVICPDCELQLAARGLAAHRRGRRCEARSACLRAEKSGYVVVAYGTEQTAMAMERRGLRIMRGYSYSAGSKSTVAYLATVVYVHPDDAGKYETATVKRVRNDQARRNRMLFGGLQALATGLSKLIPMITAELHHVQREA